MTDKLSESLGARKETRIPDLRITKPRVRAPNHAESQQVSALLGTKADAHHPDALERPQPTVAALYVQRGGAYFDLPGVDPWDEARDARAYAGPWPVVAHPPCARWSMLAGLVEHRYGYKRGEDGGCFAAALEAVRRWGGVLEHPAESRAWRAHDLMAPPRAGGWVSAGLGDPGWTCCVEQAAYGHRARKATWLYAVRVDLPSLRWGPSEATAWCTPGVSAKASRGKVVEPMNKRERLGTPEAFRDLLLGMASTVT